MNPVTSLYRRSRPFRWALYVLCIPLWSLLAFIAINSLGGYTQFGDVTLLVLLLLFAAWAWWYGEDRDRRRAEPPGD
jgi:hypothetical protein